MADVPGCFCLRYWCSGVMSSGSECHIEPERIK